MPTRMTSGTETPMPTFAPVDKPPEEGAGSVAASMIETEGLEEALVIADVGVDDWVAPVMLPLLSVVGAGDVMLRDGVSGIPVTPRSSAWERKYDCTSVGIA